LRLKDSEIWTVELDLSIKKEGDFALFGFYFPGAFVVAIRTVLAATFTAVTTLEVVGFCKNNKAFWTQVVICRSKLVGPAKATHIIGTHKTLTGYKEFGSQGGEKM